MHQLSIFFPAVTFTYEAEMLPAEKEIAKNLSLRLRIWLYFFGWEVPRPRHHGSIENPAGWGIDFYFVAQPTVPWVQATSYGMTAGLDETFEHLRQATGWATYHPP